MKIIKIASQVLNSSFVNSWVLFNQQNIKMSLLEFKVSIATITMKTNAQANRQGVHQYPCVNNQLKNAKAALQFILRSNWNWKPFQDVATKIV